jgi:hypothetical protein
MENDKRSITWRTEIGLPNVISGSDRNNLTHHPSKTAPTMNL